MPAFADQTTRWRICPSNARSPLGAWQISPGAEWLGRVRSGATQVPTYTVDLAQPKVRPTLHAVVAGATIGAFHAMGIATRKDLIEAELDTVLPLGTARSVTYRA